jgi:hypothetical protein
MSAFAKILIILAIMASFGAGVALGGLGMWRSFMQPEINRLTAENEKIGEELSKAREEASRLARNNARRDTDANNARQANADALRACVYPDELRLHLETLAKRTRDSGRYKAEGNQLQR